MQLRSLGKHYKIPTVVTDYMTAGGKSWTGLNTLGRGDLQSRRGRLDRVPCGGCAYAIMQRAVLRRGTL